QAVSSSACADGQLRIGSEQYSVLILPSLGAIKQETLTLLQKFYACGGKIIAYGRLPEANDKSGRYAAELENALHDLFGGAWELKQPSTSQSAQGGICSFIPSGYEQVAHLIRTFPLPRYITEEPG